MKCKRTKQLLLFTIIGTLFCTSIQAQNRIDMPVWGQRSLKYQIIVKMRQ